jgi:tryptophan halogenase
VAVRSFEFHAISSALSEIIPATVVESGEAGWFWQIDTYDDRDLGYVYASEFVDDEAARQEFAAHCGDGVTPADTTQYRFESGYHKRAWVGNCVAIGNAEGFIEPLQSTGLTVNTQAAVNLSNLLSANGGRNTPGVRESYNAWVQRSWESVYDFISVHYKYSRGDNEFWEAMADLAVSERVEHLIEEFDRNGLDTNIDPTVTDPSVEELTIFKPRYFYSIIRCMGATSALYEEGDFSVSDSVKNHEDNRYRQIAETVSNHFTTEQIYNSLLDR